MSTQIQIRRDTEANWTSVNPILADGEIGYDVTNNRFKVGNGVDAWNDIEFSGSSVATEEQPNDPSKGDQWFDPSTGNLLIWNGSEWITVSGGDTNIPILDAPPEDPEVGQQWFSSTDGYLYIWYGAEWVATNMKSSSDGGGQAGDPNWRDVEFLLNGEEGLADSTGNYTVTVHGDIAIASDVVKYGSGSVDTKETGNYLSVSAFNNFNGPFTVEAWVYQTTFRTGQIVARWKNAEQSWTLATLSTGELNASICHDGVDFPPEAVITTTDKMSLNQWHHVALSWDGSEYRIFLDGKLAPQTYQSTESPHNSTQTDLTIGARITSTSPTQWFFGYIDDLRITRGFCRYTEDFEPPAEHPVGLQRTVYLPAAPIEAQEDGNDADLS